MLKKWSLVAFIGSGFALFSQSSFSSSDANTLNLKAYPNPTQEFINIDLSNMDGHQYEVIIYSQQGAMMANEQISDQMDDQQLQFNVSDYREGFYYCSVVEGKKVVTSRKFLVTH